MIGIAAIRKGLAPTHRPAVASKTVDAHGGAASPVELAATTTAVASTALLDASMRLPAGMTVEAVLTQAGDGKVVGLHSKLQRLDGSKAFAACAASIWHGDFEGGLQALDVDTALSDEQRRAMLLAAETIDELMERHATTPVEPANDALSAPPFKLCLLLPERWRADAPTIAAWLDRHLQRGHWRPSVEPVTTVFAAHGLAALAALDTLNVEFAQQRAPVRHILLACGSTLGQRTVDALDGAGRLFAHNRPDGEVLGEGACALLLAPSTTADATAAPPGAATGHSHARSIQRTTARHHAGTAPANRVRPVCARGTEPERLCARKRRGSARQPPRRNGRRRPTDMARSRRR